MPGKLARPTHAKALDALWDISEHASKLKREVAVKPLAESARQKFLTLAVIALRDLGFDAAAINAEVHAQFPTPEPVRVSTPPIAIVTPMPAPSIPNMPVLVSPPPEKSGIGKIFSK